MCDQCDIAYDEGVCVDCGVSASFGEYQYPPRCEDCKDADQVYRNNLQLEYATSILYQKMILSTVWDF